MSGFELNTQHSINLASTSDRWKILMLSCLQSVPGTDHERMQLDFVLFKDLMLFWNLDVYFRNCLDYLGGSLINNGCAGTYTAVLQLFCPFGLVFFVFQNSFG